MRVSARILFFGALLLAPLCAAGCQNAGEYEVVPVSGVLKCQGKPVPKAVVMFTPQQDPGRPTGQPGRVAYGLTDENGRFTMTTYQDDDGVIVGKHAVTVSIGLDDEGRPAMKPQQFPCPLDAEREITVEPGMEDVELSF